MTEHGAKSDDRDKEEPKTRPDLFDDLYPGRFLKAALLRGGKPTVRIVDVYRQKLRGKKTAPQTVITFERQTPGPVEYVLPKICGVCLYAMFGEPPNWKGKRITFFATAEYMPRRKGVACVRIYGSPDIEKPIEVTFEPPDRAPVVMTMHVTGKRDASTKAAHPAAPAPVEEADRDSPPPEDDDGFGDRM